MGPKSQPSDLSIADFLKLTDNRRKVFVTGYVYGELGVNSFGITDMSGSIKVEYDASYKKSRMQGSFGKFVRIYGGLLRDGTLILTNRSSVFNTGPIAYGDVPAATYTAEPCLAEATKDPGMVRCHHLRVGVKSTHLCLNA